MPKQAMNYANAVIYKIVCNDLTITDCYVGSTTNFTKRKGEHKSKCKNYDFKIYQTIRANGGWVNWSMVLIEEFPTTSKLLLEQRERHWIEIFKASLNSCIPTRSEKEHYQDCKEEVKLKCHQYYETNKVQIVERSKQWTIDNKETRLIYEKQYRIDNLDKINERVKCDCDDMVIKRCLKRHQQSNKHINKMDQLHSKVIA